MGRSVTWNGLKFVRMMAGGQRPLRFVAWWQSRRKKTALGRREQRHRADARMACGLLRGIKQILTRRGCKLYEAGNFVSELRQTQIFDMMDINFREPHKEADLRSARSPATRRPRTLRRNCCGDRSPAGRVRGKQGQSARVRVRA